MPQRPHTHEIFSSSSIGFHSPYFEIIEEVRCAVIILESLLLSFVEFFSSRATICKISCICNNREILLMILWNVVDR